MLVKSFSKAIGSAGFKVFILSMIVFCGMFFFLGSFVTDRSEGELFTKRVNVAVRAIGHNLLLNAGDSTSRVLPVIEKSEGVFLLQFENEFVFQPDTLAAITQRFLAKTELSSYTVTVQECHKPAIVYGFEINPPVNNIKPCGGRTQPKACYNIEIAFADFPPSTSPYAFIGVTIIGLVSVLAVVLIGRKIAVNKPIAEQNSPVENESNSILTIGKFGFDTDNQILRIGTETISLTDKESKVLTLLNRNIGHLTLREDLIQEVWTDEGVITGRSLDMFISKLRKKLSADIRLRITNVHGKGYRLEMVSEV